VRGKGVFKKSIKALHCLNEIGYGNENGALSLQLVYNPSGAFLPPSQETLEAEYKKELSERYGIRFNKLLTLANIPINRFNDYLISTGNFDQYFKTLVCNFNPGTIDGLMCRHLISVGWDGRLYDCDFNQMLGLPLHEGCPQTVWDFDLEKLSMREISVGDHCYGCTAGQGSSCSGSIA
jgi:radical SAM/Cys-rich protein